MRAAPAGLTPRDRAILVARHGLDGEPPRTLQEIGRSLGLTRQAVRQAEAHALWQLRHPTLRRWLTDAPACSATIRMALAHIPCCVLTCHTPGTTFRYGATRRL